MKMNSEALIDWAEKNFGDILIKGNEIQVPDPWWHSEDKDHTLWINIEKGCYHAFKSGKTGNVVELVMELSSCDWDEALEIVGGEDSLEVLEKKLDEFLKNEEAKVERQPKKTITLPAKTVLINSFPEKPICRLAKKYLKERHLPSDKLMVCLEGDYRNRIVIPYYDANGKLIYWNTRALFDDGSLRYWGPKKEEFNVGKSDVLWMNSWPEPGTKLYLTEGEFDAMSLVICGSHAGACGGKVLCDRQIAMLSPYRIALALDADKAGNDIYKIAQSLLEKGGLLMNGKPRISMVRPPIQCKDWNKFLVDYEEAMVKAWITKYERVCTDDTLTKMKFGAL